MVWLICSGIIDFKGFFVGSLKTRSIRIWHPFLRLIFVDWWGVNIETKTHVLLSRSVESGAKNQYFLSFSDIKICIQESHALSIKLISSNYEC